MGNRFQALPSFTKFVHVYTKAPENFKNKLVLLAVLAFIEPKVLLQWQLVCKEWYEEKIPFCFLSINIDEEIILKNKLSKIPDAIFKPNNNDKYDYLFKVTVTGEVKTGKSSLL